MKKKAKSVRRKRREIAFYYPGPVWHSGDWIKNLVLFFDGVALLVPEYMKDKPDVVDPAIAAGLRKEHLLHILEPERIVDKSATEKLAVAMADVIASGALDPLAKDDVRFHELSYSRLGSYGDPGLAKMIFEELKSRRLARDSEDGVSIPMHPMVRALVLVLLAQILRPYGKQMESELSPATDRPQLVDALRELLSLPTLPSSGHVVSFDLETVGVDLGPIPIDEVLSFRRDHLSEHRAYARTVRRFVRELSFLPEQEQALLFEERQEELQEIARDLRRLSRKAWKRPASFALSLAGAAWTLKTGDPIGAILGAAVALFSGGESRRQPEAGAYSYIFRAADTYSLL